jgi:flagellar basal body-associated protein FliL
MSTTGPFLYDDNPAPLHTGEPRQRNGLILAILGGTVVVALLAVGAMFLVFGSSSDQAEETATVFTKALAADDTETSYGLLCDAERARVTTPEQMTQEYGHAGTPEVTGSKQSGPDSQRLVTVRWNGAGGGATTRLVVVPEGGGKVCGLAG